jgi:putative membrane protein
MSCTRRLAVLAALAAPALAAAQLQWPGKTKPQPPPGQPPASQPTPQGPAQATPQPAASGSWDPKAKERFDQIHVLNDTEVHVGQVAQQRAQAPQVKALANRFVAEHQAIEGQMAALAKSRGLAISAGPDEEKARKQAIDALPGAAGPDFDRAYVLRETQAHEKIEDQLKALREATPGSDAQLKKWLDDTENTAEAHLDAARQAKVALDGAPVQARSPGK